MTDAFHTLDEAVHGEMDIHQQAQAYHAFIRLGAWFVLHLTVLLTFLVLFLCTQASLACALMTALLVGAVGVTWLMNKR